MLEIGSGTGQHAAHWAKAFPDLDWQPTDPLEDSLASISAWVRFAGLRNLREPRALDALAEWPELGPLAGVINLNVIHISPWPVAQAIVSGAGRTVSEDGVLLFYGPFKEGGRHTGEGNAAFDADLRARDQRWGIRDLEALKAEAEQAGFAESAVHVMPANNRLVVFTR